VVVRGGLQPGQLLVDGRQDFVGFLEEDAEQFGVEVPVIGVPIDTGI